VTGKGDRWGRDIVGRSEPAFLSASTTALPPPTCTARGRLHHLRQLLFSLRGRSFVAVCFEACAGRRVRWLCPPAVPVLRAFVCLPSLPAMPTALHMILPPFICFTLLAPIQFIVLRCPVHVHVRQDHRLSPNMFASCKTVPLAAATRACSGGPCTGSVC